MLSILTLALGSCNYQRSCLSGGHQEIQRERADRCCGKAAAGWIWVQGEKAQAEKAVDAKAKQRFEEVKSVCPSR